MSNSVSTALFIGGKERQTAGKMAIADPAKPGVVVGYAASATTQDVSDAVAAAKAAFPAWSRLTPQQRAEQMKAAIVGVPDSPNPFASEDGAILSQENGKVRLEGWVDALVLQIRWNLALMHADEVNASKVLEPVPGHIPTRTTVSYQPLGVVSIIVPFNWPIAILGAALPHALLAGNTVIVKPPLTAPLPPPEDEPPKPDAPARAAVPPPAEPAAWPPWVPFPQATSERAARADFRKIELIRRLQCLGAVLRS